MGGRRARSLSDLAAPGRSVVGIGRMLGAAIRQGDPDTIAKRSIQISKKSFVPSKIDSYFGYFVPFIHHKLSAGIQLIDARKEVRAEWSRIKREHGIEFHGVRNEAVVQAVIDFLRARLEGAHK